jgi:hypothetical protein
MASRSLSLKVLLPILLASAVGLLLSGAVQAATMASPRISPAGGTYRDPVRVSILAPLPGLAIRYTTDGTTPTSATGRNYTVPFTVASRTVVTAAAFRLGTRVSAPAVATYTFFPGATTGGLTSLDAAESIVTGTVDPRGLRTTAWFEWGTDPNLQSPSLTPTVHFYGSAGSRRVSAGMTGLSEGTTYHYRLVARSSAGTSRGRIDCFTVQEAGRDTLVVNSTGDQAIPPLGKMTLREAVSLVNDGGTILFAPALSGRTIDLTTIGERHSILRAESFSMIPGVGWKFNGYLDRDYGRSALYATKNLTIDASALPAGVTVRWAGGEPARILAVLGDLTMNKVKMTGGNAVWQATTEFPTEPVQPYTLARGGALAVWGTARLTGCTLSGNRCEGDPNGSRDRGAFGGGIYADSVQMDSCVVSGNTALGYGAAGGGVFSITGRETSFSYSYLDNTSVTGNRVTGQHAYGGGVYSDGGGPGNLNVIALTNCTLARNLVEDNPAIAQSQMSQYYYRGGGFYMSNGYLELVGSTVAENRVTGIAFPFSDKPNMGGGGIAATIGNAHTVEDMKVWHSIVVGNTLNGVAEDLFTGSLLDFYSLGYNRIGVIDFTQMLVPMPTYMTISRRHYPKVGDMDGLGIGEVLDLPKAVYDASIVSVGADSGGPAMLYYPPKGLALRQILPIQYSVPHIWTGWWRIDSDIPDDGAKLILADIVTKYGSILGSNFADQFGDLTGLTFYDDPYTWPSDSRNKPWIKFWHDLDTAIGDRLGQVRLGDFYWGTFPEGDSRLGKNIDLYTWTAENTLPFLNEYDALGCARFTNGSADIGAIEGGF